MQKPFNMMTDDELLAILRQHYDASPQDYADGRLIVSNYTSAMNEWQRRPRKYPLDTHA